MCCGERPASLVFFQMNSRERIKLECSHGVRQEDSTGPALFCLPLWPVLARVRGANESQGVDAYAHLDSNTIAAYQISPLTVGVVPFLELELTARDTPAHLNPGQTLLWPRRKTRPHQKV